MIMKLFIVIMIMGLLFSCKKAEDWLDVPRSKNDKLLESLKDCQSILNNTALFNFIYPSLGLVSADNIYIKESSLNNISPIERNAYLWRTDIYEGLPAADYNSGYKVINHSNVILEFLKDLGPLNDYQTSIRNDIAGQAYFFRAYMFHELSTLYCKQYLQGSATLEKGLCLKLTSNINEIVKRSTLAETYSQIVKDVRDAITLLPKESNPKTRPNKYAAYALMARVLLNMNDFVGARLYVDSALNSSATIIDFASIPSLTRPYRFPDFQTGNSEILFYGGANLYSVLFPNDNAALGLVDTLLYRSYSDDDLRKQFFFNAIDSRTIKFKGSYTGISYNFHGFAVNELVLIKAECEVRVGELSVGIKYLNDLLKKRFRPGTYDGFASTDRDSALLRVLQERRKELPFTGLIRWQDLRRLNNDPRLATNVIRIINGDEIMLKPGEAKYVFPIPQSEIDFSGIEQNER